MAIDQDGNFLYEDRELYGGMRQDLPAHVRRWRVIKNSHLFKRGSLTHRNGTRALNSTAITGSPDIKAGMDARFSGGTQKVVVVASTDAHVFVPSTRTFTAASLTLADADPALLMFADVLTLFNRTDKKKYDGSSWSNLSGTPPAGNLTAPHANRLIVSGVNARPYEFYYSGVRNPDSWDTANDKVIVGGVSGEAITALGTLGSYLLVCTQNASWVYQQSATNPGDWDFITISESTGNINRVLYEVSQSGVHMSFGWSIDGPVVFYRIGDTVSFKPLWQCVRLAMQGIEDTPMEGFEQTRFSYIRAGYQADIEEIRYGITKAGGTENDGCLCFDLRSVIAYIQGDIEQPYATFKDNETTGIYPCDALFQIRVDSNGLPSVTGRDRLFGGRNGVIYELDSPDVFTDDGNTIPHGFVRSGFSGVEDGVGGHRKVCNRARIRATHDGGYSITVQVSADGDVSVDDDTIDLDSGVGLWGDGGIWTTNPSVGKWNAQGYKTGVGYLSVHGESFEVYGYDVGAIDGEFEISEVSIEGRVYERV